jgi:hypothetical protein
MSALRNKLQLNDRIISNPPTYILVWLMGFSLIQIRLTLQTTSKFSVATFAVMVTT